jgi:hypothetical protein
MLIKPKIYCFEEVEFNKCLKDIKKEKGDIKQFYIWIGIYLGLFCLGIVSSKWLLSCLVGLGTSRLVKIIMR